MQPSCFHSVMFTVGKFVLDSVLLLFHRIDPGFEKRNPCLNAISLTQNNTSGIVSSFHLFLLYLQDVDWEERRKTEQLTPFPEQGKDRKGLNHWWFDFFLQEKNMNINLATGFAIWGRDNPNVNRRRQFAWRLWQSDIGKRFTLKDRALQNLLGKRLTNWLKTFCDTLDRNGFWGKTKSMR